MPTPPFHQLLSLHSDKIWGLAYELRATMGRRLTQRALHACGVEGLFESALRFDPSVGSPFWAFAYPRVRGAMVDAIRETAPLSRSIYAPLSAAREALRRAVPRTQAYEEARAQLDRANEVLGLISYEAAAIVRGEDVGVHDGLERLTIEDEDEPAPYVDPADDGASRVVRVEAPDPERALVEVRRLATLHAALGKLTMQEQLIVRALYLEERGLVNEELGISKSWASRIHTRALRRLRELLEPEWGCERNGGAGQAEERAAEPRSEGENTNELPSDVAPIPTGIGEPMSVEDDLTDMAA